MRWGWRAQGQSAWVHGRQLTFLPPPTILEGLREPLRRQALYLCIFQRLAVVLHRGLSETELPAIAPKGDQASIKLRFPPKWQAKHPLTQSDLAGTAGYLRSAGLAAVQVRPRPG